MKQKVAGAKDIEVSGRIGNLRMTRNNPFYSSISYKDTIADRYKRLLDEVNLFYGFIDLTIPDILICP